MKRRQLQKNKKSSNIISLALIFSRIIIFVGVRWVFYGQKSVTQPTNLIEEESISGDLNQDTQKIYYIGENLLVAGTMTPTDSFTTYTHDFVSDQWDAFWLKSKDIDLYTYEWTVQLKWSITEFRNDLPIIQVTEIVWDTDSQDVADGDIDTNTNYYLFKDDKVGFDLSISQWFVVEKVWEEIHIIDETNNDEIKLKISPFLCTPWDSLRDCAALESNFTNIWSDSFISSQWVKFYNLTETITWLAFDPTGTHGYYLTPTNEQEFASFANLMMFVDEGRLKNVIEPEVTKLCKNINYTMSNADTISYDYATQGVVKASLVEETDSGVMLNCTLAIRLWNTFTVSPIWFFVTGEEIDNNSDTDTEENEEEVIPLEESKEIEDEPIDDNDNTPSWIEAPEQQISQVPENRSGSGWFRYSSVRGYDVYFSSQSISYAGEILESPTDLWISWLRCVYKVNVIQWQRADDVDTNPDITIYECIGETAGTSQYKNIWTSWDNVFLAQWNTSNLTSMTVLVE